MATFNYAGPAPLPFKLDKITASAVASVRLTKGDEDTITAATESIRANLAELESLSPQGQKARAAKLIEKYHNGVAGVTLRDIQAVTSDHKAAAEILEATREAVAPAITKAHDSVKPIAFRYQAEMEKAFDKAKSAFDNALEAAGEAFGEDGLFDHIGVRIEATAAHLAELRRQMEGDGPNGSGLQFLCGVGVAQNPYSED